MASLILLPELGIFCRICTALAGSWLAWQATCKYLSIHPPRSHRKSLLSAADSESTKNTIVQYDSTHRTYWGLILAQAVQLYFLNNLRHQVICSDNRAVRVRFPNDLVAEYCPWLEKCFAFKKAQYKVCFAVEVKSIEYFLEWFADLGLGLSGCSCCKSTPLRNCSKPR